MNRNSVLRNTLSAAGQTLVQAAVMFLVYRFLIDHLGIEQLGVWSVVLATTSALRVTELGLAASVTTFVAAHRSRGDEEAAGETVDTAAITVAVMVAIVLVVLQPILTRFLPSVLPGAAAIEGLQILPYALMAMWLTAVASVWLAALDGCLRSDVRAALVVVSTLVFMVITLIAVPGYGLRGVAVAQVAQGVVLTVSGWTAVRRVIRSRRWFPARWRSARVREMVGYGANVQIMAIVMLLFEPTTKVLLTRFGGLASTGHFELAQQLIMRVRALLVETNRVMVPVLAGLKGGGGDVRRYYARHLRFLFVLLTPAFGWLIALSPAISELWIGSHQAQFVTMAVCLTAAWYINGLTGPAYFAYLGSGELRWLTTSHVILGVSNVLLGIALGPVFGWKGVIAAFAFSLVAGSLLPVYMFHRKHDLSLSRILSRQDVILGIVCGLASATAVAAYPVAVRMDSTALSRSALVAALALLMLMITGVHPLAREMLVMMRAALWRSAAPQPVNSAIE